MGHGQHQQPPHRREEHLRCEVGVEKLARLAGVGLAYKKKHRRGQRGAKLPKAIHIHHAHGVEHHVERAANPQAHLAGEQREQHAGYVNIEEKLGKQVVVKVGATPMGQRKHGAKNAKNIHRKEKCAVLHDRTQQAAGYSSHHYHILPFITEPFFRVQK